MRLTLGHDEAGRTYQELAPDLLCSIVLLKLPKIIVALVIYLKIEEQTSVLHSIF
jgi:hypothetical protein